MSTARPSKLEALLFWLMLLGGAAVLAPCLILPAWLEYQAQLDRRAAAQANLAEQQKRLAAVTKQIEHIHTDPAYVLRLAEREFGRVNDSVIGPAIEVAPSPEPEFGTSPPAAADDVLLPELSAFIDDALARYPHAWFFVYHGTRPFLMAMSGALMVAAVVLLGIPRGRLPKKRGTHAV